MRKPAGRTIFLLAAAACGLAATGYFLLDSDGRADQPGRSRLSLADIPFNGARAYGYLKQICALGPRPSGSPAMQAQQRMLLDHFRKLGGTVRVQEFRVRHPVNGDAVPMANLLVEWHPERRERILICAHYDTRPFPDRDRVNRRGTFIGANDGASGVALLMEMAHLMPALQGRLGVDFLLLDGEEFVFEEPGTYFLGSTYFAENYIDDPPAYRYRWGVLLDMVGDAQLEIYQERNSMSWSDTRPLVAEIWHTARDLGVREFVARKKYEVNDDHLKLRNVAKIPTCDIIDFDYPAWHTQQDVPDKCSALSLAKVGWVVHEWLSKAVKKPS